MIRQHIPTQLQLENISITDYREAGDAVGAKKPKVCTSI
jgi:hypothetical protein